MMASIQSRYGPPAVLQLKQVPIPTIKAHELLVAVYAATVNRSDCAMLRAKPFIMRFFTGLFRPKEPILGTDFAGTVVAVGNKVRNFKVGDKVFGFNDGGLRSHAQFLAISETNSFTTLPKDCTFEQAAASTEGAHYAYNFINKIPLKAGQRVLVNGASGAIGSAAVQLLTHFSVHVTAVCGTKNIGLVKALGAMEVIDYKKEDFTKIRQQFHYVFDTVGKSSFIKCKPILLPGGAYISSELGAGSQNLFYALFTPIFGGKKVIFPYPKDRLASIILIKELIAQGKFRAVIDRTYPLDQIVQAFEYVEKGHKTGNVVVTMKNIT